MASVKIGDYEIERQEITPEDVANLPVGREFRGITEVHPGETVTLVKTEDGFEAYRHDYTEPFAVLETATCEPMSKAGGRGNATTKCTMQNGNVWRMEWINQHNVQFDWWVNRASMDGGNRYTQSRGTVVLSELIPRDLKLNQY